MTAPIAWARLACVLAAVAALAGGSGYLSGGVIRAMWMAEVGFSLALMAWWGANFLVTRNDEQGTDTPALLRWIAARRRA